MGPRGPGDGVFATHGRAGDGSVVTVQVIVHELQRRGVDPRPLLEAHRLPLRSFNPFARVPRDAVLAFVETCRRVTRDPAMHVTAVSKAELGLFHFADTMVMLAPSIGFALRAVMRGFHLFNSGCRWRLEEKREEMVLHFEAIYEAEVHPVDVECAFMAFASRMRAASAGHHLPVRMDIATPDWGAGEVMAREAGCPVVHRADGNRLVVSREAWDSPPRLAHPALGALLEPDDRTASGAGDTLSRVRAAIAEGLRRGGAGVADIARRLGWGVRSLQRRLQAEGTSYATLLDDERRAVAVSLLERAELSATNIADLLGFSEQSAFSRAFRRWTGLSPRAYRKRRGQ